MSSSVWGSRGAAKRAKQTKGLADAKVAQKVTGPGMLYGTDENANDARKDNLVAFAFANIGVQDSAFEGRNARHHWNKIEVEVAELLTLHDVQGILFSEVGLIEKGLRAVHKAKFQEVVAQGFLRAGAA